MKWRVGLASVAGISGFAFAAGSASAINVVKVAPPGDTSFCSKAATYRSIQSAVNAAHIGTQIQLCPGTYNEQIVIPLADKNVVIGALSPGVVIHADDPNTTQDSVISVQPRGVEILGVTIDGGSMEPVSEGVDVANGASADIEKSHITDVYGPGFSSCMNTCSYNTGVGVQADGGYPGPGATITLKKDTIDGYGAVGVSVVGRGSSANLVDNVIDNPLPNSQAAVELSENGTGVLNGNTLTGPLAPIHLNSFGPFGPLGVSVEGDQLPGLPPSNGVVIENNTLTHFLEGIDNAGSNTEIFNNHIVGSYLTDVESTGPGVRVQNNRIDGTGAGSTLDAGIAADGVGGLIAGNTVQNEAEGGVFLGSFSSGNAVFHNTATNDATGNGIGGRSPATDCGDGSTGTGTAGTANRWVGNIGGTSSPAGICTPPNK